MARRSMRAGRRSGRPVRGMDWGGQSLAINGVSSGATSSTYVLLPSVVRADYVDPTIMATRMTFGIYLPASSAGGLVAAGVIAWSDINDVVPSDPPGPITNVNQDWIIRQVFAIPPSYPGGFIGGPSLDTAYYSKARRRLGNDRGLLLVVENFATGVSLNYAVDVRFLLKE